jgi:cytochrome b6-f complex iron-sulfur subunit
MAEKISELTGDERDKRIAELKRKMQEAAKKAQAAKMAGESAAAEDDTSSPVAIAESPSEPADLPAPEPEPVVPAPDTSPAAGNGAAVPKPAAPPKAAASKPKPAKAPAAVGPTTAEMNRREFLTYAWGAALGLLVLETGAASFFFMYPRFKAGEFGGKFFIGPESALPDHSAAPQPYPAGKFWMVTTVDGEARALYMVCTHLGCLYKWEPSNGRFECPCHGSKFTHDGWYIEGPAPRSLDYFETDVVDGVVVVDTGNKVNGSPAAVSPARIEAV